MPRIATILLALAASASLTAAGAIGPWRHNDARGLAPREDVVACTGGLEVCGGCSGTGHTCYLPKACWADGDCHGDRNGRGVSGVSEAHCDLSLKDPMNGAGKCVLDACVEGWDMDNGKCHCSSSKVIGQMRNGVNSCS